MELNKYIELLKGKLDKPLCVIDTETTSADKNSAEIISLAVLKLNLDNSLEEYTFYCKPKNPIEPGATAVNGFDSGAVEHFLPFNKYAKQIQAILKDTIIAGYNSNNFDNCILQRELENAGYKLEIDRTYDAFPIFKKHHRQRLANAVSIYCGETLENSHDCLADVIGTFKVISKQVELENLPIADIKEKEEGSRKSVDDLDRYLIKSGSSYILNFSKHKGKMIHEVDKSFLSWVMRNDFIKSFKDIVKKYL